jgi:hypothetical protein
MILIVFWGALLPAERERIVRHPQHPSCLAAKAPLFPVTRRYRSKQPFPPLFAVCRS